ncbi:unnamed protein product, partial [Didymodactylos carnosus]
MFNEALINSLPINKSKSVDKAILAAVVKDGRSFGDFNRLGIRQLIATVVGTGYRIPSRFQIRRKLKYLYQVERQKLKDLLENVNYISLASGIWSNNRYASKILNELSKLKTETKSFSITTDGTKNMCKILKNISGIMTGIMTVYCIAHGLHLTICNGLRLWSNKKADSNSVSNITETFLRIHESSEELGLSDNHDNMNKNDIDDLVTLVDEKRVMNSITAVMEKCRKL